MTRSNKKTKSITPSSSPGMQGSKSASASSGSSIARSGSQGMATGQDTSVFFVQPDLFTDVEDTREMVDTLYKNISTPVSANRYGSMEEPAADAQNPTVNAESISKLVTNVVVFHSLGPPHHFRLIRMSLILFKIFVKRWVLLVSLSKLRIFCPLEALRR